MINFIFGLSVGIVVGVVVVSLCHAAKSRDEMNFIDENYKSLSVGCLGEGKRINLENALRKSQQERNAGIYIGQKKSANEKNWGKSIERNHQKGERNNGRKERDE